MNAIRRHRTISGIVSLATIAVVAAPTAANVQIVSPPSAANSEGDASVTPSQSPIRIQYLIPASDFAGLPASQRYIVGFNFRSDHTQKDPVNWTFASERTWMSTTDKTNLTAIFDANHGPDKTLVFDGSPSYSFLATGPTAGPRGFGEGQKLQTPFLYDPTKGNLLIEHQDFSKAHPTPVTVDLVAVPTVRTLLNGGNPTAATGDPLNLAVVFQLDFAVPEPSTPVLAGLSCLCLSAWRRKGTRQLV